MKIYRKGVILQRKCKFFVNFTKTVQNVQEKSANFKEKSAQFTEKVRKLKKVNCLCGANTLP